MNTSTQHNSIWRTVAQIFTWRSLPDHQHIAGHRALDGVAFSLLAVYLCILPVGHTIAVRGLVFFSLVFYTFWTAWERRIHLRWPLIAPWLLYGAVALVSVTYAVDPLWSLGEIKGEIGYGILILMLTATWVKDATSMKALAAILIIGDVLQVAAVLLKVVVLDAFWLQPAARIPFLLNEGPGVSLYAGVGYLSTYIVTVIPVITAVTLLLPDTRRAERNSLVVLLFFNVLALFLTNNRMGPIVLMVEILVATGFVLTKRNNSGIGRTMVTASILLPLLVFLEIILVYTRPLTHLESNPRIGMWPYAMEKLIHNPLTGLGFGRTVMVHGDPEFVRIFHLEHAHNVVLDQGVQMGLPGIIAFLVLLGATLHALWPRRWCADLQLWTYAVAGTTMSIGMFLKSMTDDFFVRHNALLYWALVGAIMGVLAGKASPARGAASDSSKQDMNVDSSQCRREQSCEARR